MAQYDFYNEIVALKCAQETVWAFRAESEHWWPTPVTLKALRFMFTETGEVEDALLRLTPEFARSRARNIDLRQEWADVCFMAISSLGKDIKEPHRVAFADLADVAAQDRADYAAYCAGRALGLYRGFTIESRSWQSYVRDILGLCALELGPGLCAEVERRLERIRLKHMTPWLDPERVNPVSAALRTMGEVESPLAEIVTELIPLHRAIMWASYPGKRLHARMMFEWLADVEVITVGVPDIDGAVRAYCDEHGIALAEL